MEKYLKMVWLIRKEVKKHFPNIKFNVRLIGHEWYEIMLNIPTKTIEDAIDYIVIMEEIYVKMNDFQERNNIMLSIC